METIIYVSIIGVVVASFINFGFSIAGSRSKTYAVQEIHINAREALSIITKKIRSAENINVGASTFGTHPGVLSLAMAEAEKDPTIIFWEDGDLKMTEGFNDAIILNSEQIKISELIFVNLTPQNKRNSVKINLTAKYDTQEKTEFAYTHSLQSAASVRK